MYTALQPRQFSSNTTKLLFADSYLCGVAFNWFEPYFYLDGIDRPTWLDNFNKFSAKLQDTFGDPEQARTAAKKIHDLKQNKSVGKYWANFQRYAVQTDFNNAAKCFTFRNGLKDLGEGVIVGCPKGVFLSFALILMILVFLCSPNGGQKTPKTNELAILYRSPVVATYKKRGDIFSPSKGHFCI